MMLDSETFHIFTRESSDLSISCQKGKKRTSEAHTISGVTQVHLDHGCIAQTTGSVIWPRTTIKSSNSSGFLALDIPNPLYNLKKTSAETIKYMLEKKATLGEALRYENEVVKKVGAIRALHESLTSGHPMAIIALVLGTFFILLALGTAFYCFRNRKRYQNVSAQNSTTSYLQPRQVPYFERNESINTTPETVVTSTALSTAHLPPPNVLSSSQILSANAANAATELTCGYNANSQAIQFVAVPQSSLYPNLTK